MKYYSPYFGQAYGDGNYGECAYSPTAEQAANENCTVAAGGGTSTPGGSSGGLADTGIAVITIVTLASLIIFIALVVRIWRRKPALQAVEVSEAEEDLSRQP
jgi:hypothetical protein